MVDIETKNINCANIAFIFKTSVGSINSSFTEDNISVVKKVTLPNGSELPYISGQAIRRYIRDKWEELSKQKGFEWVKLSPVTQQKTAVGRAASSACDPVKFIDDDLFGFMLAGKGGTEEATTEGETAKTEVKKGGGIKKRTSPVRVSPAIAFFPFQDDRDLGVRITEEGKINPEKMMPPFETEVYYNYFRCNILIELDRIGVFKDDYYGGKKALADLSKPEKERRMDVLIHAIRDLWGGGKQGRFLTDISPKFVVFTLQTSKKPIFLERLEMNAQDESIFLPALEKTLKNEAGIIEDVIIGAVHGFGGITVSKETDDKVKDKSEKIKICELKDAFDRISNSLKSAIH